MEIWLKIKSDRDDSDYEVSSEGRVRNVKTGKLIKGRLNKRDDGYYRVNIHGKDEYIHRLVAKTFYDGDHCKMHVNHIDGNKSNNSLANLEWTTPKENANHAFKKSLRFPVVKNVVRCKFCKCRGEYDICEGMDDDFYCGFGTR